MWLTNGSEGRAGASEEPSHDARTSARTIWVDLLLYPTHTLPTALAPVLVGAGLAFRDDVFAPLPMAVGFVGSWAIHLAGVFTDNHELLRKHPAVVEHPELTRAVTDGTLRLETLRLAIAACLAVALLAAPYLVRIGGAPVIALGAVGIAASLSYNGGPWAYARRGLADPVFLLMFWVVAIPATYYIGAAARLGAPDPWRLVAALPLPVYLVGLPCGAIVTAVMLVDDMRDHAFDAVKGWRTGAVRFGLRWSRAEITALVAAAYAAPLFFWLALGMGAWVLLPLASAPIAVAVVHAVWTREGTAALLPVSPRMAGLALVHSALLGVGLAISG